MSKSGEKLLIDVGSTYFKVSTSEHIEQHFRDFNKDILDDLMHKCGDDYRSFSKRGRSYLFVGQWWFEYRNNWDHQFLFIEVRQKYCL